MVVGQKMQMWVGGKWSQVMAQAEQASQGPLKGMVAGC